MDGQRNRRTIKGINMCITCWKGAGSHKIINDATKYVAGLVDKVYEFSGAGGNAHIVVDDMNLENSHIDFCLKEVKKDKNSLKEKLSVEAECLTAMKELSIKERYSAMAIHEGY